MDRKKMNAAFSEAGLRWVKIETLMGFSHPRDLNPQDWILTDADDKIVALGEGPTRRQHANKPTLEQFGERIAKMGIGKDDERYAELKTSVMGTEIRYPSPEDIYEKLKRGETVTAVELDMTALLNDYIQQYKDRSHITEDDIYHKGKIRVRETVNARILDLIQTCDLVFFELGDQIVAEPTPQFKAWVKAEGIKPKDFTDQYKICFEQTHERYKGKSVKMLILEPRIF